MTFIKTLGFGIVPAFCLRLHMAFMDITYRKDGRLCLYEQPLVFPSQYLLSSFGCLDQRVKRNSRQKDSI